MIFMELSFYEQSADCKEYLSFVKDKYSTQNNFSYFSNDLTASLAFSEKYQKPYFITVKNNGQMCGHIALIIDPHMKEGEAFFGFLDCVNDINIFTTLWQALIEYARSKGITVLKGPINATAWHQYRAMSMTDTSPFFKTELFCEPYYYDFLKAQHPSKEITYHSGYRKSFDFIIKATEPAYRQSQEQGFVISEIKDISRQQLTEVLTISKTVFKDNWGYTDVSEESFGALYSSQKLDAYLNKIYFLLHDGKIVGYLSSLIEDPTTLILKTIAIFPEYQGKGLGNALVHKAHVDAREHGYKKIIYALVREDNKIKNFPKDEAVEFRKYSTFEYTL
jgi:ribosomal protein S18 acetylase RimI-like enzyme